MMRCQHCGAPEAENGRYGEMMMYDMLDKNAPVVFTKVFYCASCVAEMDREEEFDREVHQEMMKDPEYAEKVRQIDEEALQEFHERLARTVKIN